MPCIFFMPISCWRMTFLVCWSYLYHADAWLILLTHNHSKLTHDFYCLLVSITCCDFSSLLMSISCWRMTVLACLLLYYADARICSYLYLVLTRDFSCLLMFIPCWCMSFYVCLCLYDALDLCFIQFMSNFSCLLVFIPCWSMSFYVCLSIIMMH